MHSTTTREVGYVKNGKKEYYRSSIWYGTAVFFLRFLRVLLWPFVEFKVYGAERVPTSGPLMMAFKHHLGWDIPIMGIATKRWIHFMAKRELFEIPILGWWMTKVGAFAVDRDQPTKDTLKKSYHHFESEEVIGIFPEGTRHTPEDDVAEIGTGAATIALHRLGLPIEHPAIQTGAVAYGFKWAAGFWPRFRVAVVFGHLITPDEIKQYDRTRLTYEIRAWIKMAFSYARARL